MSEPEPESSAPPLAVVLDVTRDLTASHLRTFVSFLDRLSVPGWQPIVMRGRVSEETLARLAAWAHEDPSEEGEAHCWD